jgi:mono/diheme cytochrome c family protein
MQIPRIASRTNCARYHHRRFILLIVFSIQALLVTNPAVAADLDDGAKIVARRCAQCHGPTGMGDGKALQELNITVKPVPWPDKPDMAKFTDSQLTQIITLGGKGVGKAGAMPKFQNKLTDDQIADVVAYVRSLAP